MENIKFSYDAFTNRNIGFVTEQEQEKLKNATIFVCGTGGMGGACILSLVRSGIGHLIISDIDEFEMSNLNRQVFCTLNTVNHHKAEATKELCLKINPDLEIEVLHGEDEQSVDRITKQADVIVNGTDDLGASLLLYRMARQNKKPVIDAYASPLPSVYVTRATDKMPEERLGYPTQDTAWNELSEEQRSGAFLKEAEYIMVHSSSRHYIDLKLAGEVTAGTRSRMSFAPMVITAGTLMAYEATTLLMKSESATDCNGWFFNPYRGRVEHPKNKIVAAIMRPIVRKFLNDLVTAA